MTRSMSLPGIGAAGPVARLVGIEVGVVSGVFNLVLALFRKTCNKESTALNGVLYSYLPSLPRLNIITV
jgi:hypothetical protein